MSTKQVCCGGTSISLAAAGLSGTSSNLPKRNENSGSMRNMVWGVEDLSEDALRRIEAVDVKSARTDVLGMMAK